MIDHGSMSEDTGQNGRWISYSYSSLRLSSSIFWKSASAATWARQPLAPAMPDQAQASGRLLVVGAYYALGTGEVDFFDTGADSSAFKTS